MTDLTFLEADRPLVKSYSLDSQGVLTKESYPNAFEFTSHTTKITTLAEFHAALTHHASLGHCLLKGNVTRSLVAESRAGSTDPNLPTRFLCLDFDRTGTIQSIEFALESLGLGRVSYIIQYSASYGVEVDKGLTAHVFIRLSQLLSPSSLKQWLIHLNLVTPWLRSELALTKTNNAISWPLDVSTCQNDKLIYIAPPQLAEGVRSTCTHERIQIVEKELPALDTSHLVIPSAEQNRVTANTMLDALRTKAGLPGRKWSSKIDKTTGLEVLARPDASTLTGVKAERGFVYFNFNGGDSWGYYHPAESPEVIRNFKGEPNYLTSELIPEYWEQILQTRKKARHAALEARRSTEVTVLAFRDFRTAVYYNGTFEPATDTLRLARATSETQLRDFLLENGQPLPETIPIWDLCFDPQSTAPRVDTAARKVNTFTPTKYMEPTSGWRAEDTLSRRCPAIATLIDHAVGRDPNLAEHWLNWHAVILRHRIHTRTCWALQGVEGTGKGTWVNHILVPLLGSSNVAQIRMVQLEDIFNSYAETSLIAVIDEAEIGSSRKADMIMATLKNQITEPTISIRKMFTPSYQVKNYCNYMFMSNRPTPIVVSATDRRINCAEYGERKSRDDQPYFEQIASELDTFAAYLWWRKADVVAAGRIIETAQRDLMKATSTNSLDTTAKALTTGDLDFFWDGLPAGESGILSAESQALHDSYVSLIHQAIRSPDGVQRLTRDEIRVLFAYNIGDVAKTPTKFTSMLRHHRVNLTPIRIDGRVVRGLEVNWKTDPAWLREKLAELTEKQPLIRAIK